MSDDRRTDPFAPPELPTEVCCIHCGETYDSWQIEWRILSDPEGQEQGFWCCPMPGCDGMGFGFDILPTDPNYQDEHGGWIFDDVDEDEEWDEDLDELCREAEESPDAFTEFDLELDLPGDVPEWDEPPGEGNGPGDDFPFSMN